LKKIDKGFYTKRDALYGMLFGVCLPILATLLKSFGVKVTVANGGLEAYEAVQKNNYQLILIDCQMPMMDGFESTKKIRAFQLREKLNPVPILALTANAIEEE